MYLFLLPFSPLIKIKFNWSSVKFLANSSWNVMQNIDTRLKIFDFII